MSDDNDAESMIARLTTRVVLPEDFFEKSGPLGACWNELRQFPRFYFRTAAALEFQSSLPALARSQQAERVYVKDISRVAVAILRGEQLFPGERLRLTFTDGTRCNTTVTRCRRIQADCYEVAARFDVPAADGP